MPDAEEVAHRALDARLRLTVPINSQREQSRVERHFMRNGKPDVRDDARPTQLGQRRCGAGFDGHLSPLPLRQSGLDDDARMASKSFNVSKPDNGLPDESWARAARADAAMARGRRSSALFISEFCYLIHRIDSHGAMQEA